MVLLAAGGDGDSELCGVSDLDVDDIWYNRWTLVWDITRFCAVAFWFYVSRLLGATVIFDSNLCNNYGCAISDSRFLNLEQFLASLLRLPDRSRSLKALLLA